MQSIEDSRPDAREKSLVLSPLYKLQNKDHRNTKSIIYLIYKLAIYNSLGNSKRFPLSKNLLFSS